MDATCGPLLDFGSDPRDSARPNPNWRGKVLLLNQHVESRLRETRDRFHFGQTQKNYVVESCRRCIEAGFYGLLRAGHFPWGKFHWRKIRTSFLLGKLATD